METKLQNANLILSLVDDANTRHQQRWRVSESRLRMLQRVLALIRRDHDVVVVIGASERVAHLALLKTFFAPLLQLARVALASPIAVGAKSRIELPSKVDVAQFDAWLAYCYDGIVPPSSSFPKMLRFSHEHQVKSILNIYSVEFFKIMNDELKIFFSFLNEINI